MNNKLPDYLYPYKGANGRTYYKYKHPTMDKSESFGSDKKKAVEAARYLNRELGNSEDLITRVLTPKKSGDTVSDYIPRFRKHLKTRTVNHEPLSEHTLKAYNQIINTFEPFIGDTPIASVTRADCVEILDSYPIKSRNKNQAILSMMFKYALSDGLTEDNPVAKIMVTPKQKVTRQPLTLEGYRAIYPHAETCIQIAMSLELITLQRRGDIRTFKKSEWKDGITKLIQSKTYRHGPAAYLEFDFVGTELEQVIERANKSDIPSPYLVHYRPRYKNRKNEECDHWSQLSREQISKGFAKARKLSGYYEHLTPKEKPTFHEIRALGANLYLEKGWTEEDIQKLLGHTKLSQTFEYLYRGKARFTKTKTPDLDIK